MNTYVWGRSEEVSEDEWLRAADWYGRRLLGDRGGGITLLLELSERIRGRTAQLGWVRGRPKTFLMQVETRGHGRRGLLYSFGHEMVHLKQIVMGELGRSSNGLIWRSKCPVPDEWVDEPWEREAYGMERELYREYSRSLLVTA